VGLVTPKANPNEWALIGRLIAVRIDGEHHDQRIKRARLPVDGGEEIVFTEHDWKIIERAYGHDLPPEARAQILIATEALNVVGNAEINAPGLERLKANTKKLRDAAESLLKETGRPAQEIAGCVSIEGLTEALATVVKEYPNDDLQFLLMVRSVLTACNLRLGAWETDGGLREGFIWDAWVQSIGEVMEHHRLPSAARKDSDKRDSDQISPFVSLIKELQKHIPEQLRRHDHPMVTSAALEQAIHRARKSNWWPQLLPQSIREKFASFLETPRERAEKL
jgi:hypothetical protein